MKYAYIYIYVHTYAYMKASARIYSCMYIHMYMYGLHCIVAFVYVCTYLCRHIYTCIYTYSPDLVWIPRLLWPPRPSLAPRALPGPPEGVAGIFLRSLFSMCFGIGWVLRESFSRFWRDFLSRRGDFSPLPGIFFRCRGFVPGWRGFFTSLKFGF